jgi:anaerobic selenocysteine-containing dehydrogenase
MREVISSCRICAGQCSLRLSLDDEGGVVSIRGDRANPVSRGYACIKGLTLHEAHASPDRVLHPLKRMEDGTFARIPMAQALDEIADRIRDISGRLGPHAVAGFRGTMNYSNFLANALLPEFIRALGSRSFFSTMTIDQSAKWVNVERLGAWAGGRTPVSDSDVLMVVGTNPLVSLSTFNFWLQNPMKSIKEARERGLKLIVIDPRFTETAAFADLHLRPLPGEDAALMAGLLHVVLARGWHDEAFCAKYVEGLDALRAAVAGFTPAVAAARTGLTAAEIEAAAALFAEPLPDRAKRGTAASGTGANMGPHSNLAEHLLECLNVVCGRYPRAGDLVPNPGVVGPRMPRLEQVIPPQRGWERGWRDGDGFGMMFGQRMTATLPDMIRSKGEDRVAALIIDGGNPANAIPGSDAASAFAELELLVSIDPFITETGQLSHYILPPTMMLERNDIGGPDYEAYILQVPYAQYVEPVVKPPAGAELIDDWRVFWELGSRLGLSLELAGRILDSEIPPTSEALIEMMLQSSSVPFDEIRQAVGGRIFDEAPMRVAAGNSDARFSVAPADVRLEIAELAGEGSGALAASGFRFSVRRMREVQNTQYHALPTIRKRVPRNPAWMHPDDLAELGIADGDTVEIRSEHGAIETPVTADPTMRRKVVAMAHGWGGNIGTNVNRLTDRRIGRDPINAMPVLTGFPVCIQLVSAKAVPRSGMKGKASASSG